MPDVRIEFADGTAQNFRETDRQTGESHAVRVHFQGGFAVVVLGSTAIRAFPAQLISRVLQEPEQ